MVRTLTTSALEALLPHEDPSGRASALRRILVAYSEPHRRYHGVQHVNLVVSQALALLATAGARRGPVAWAALWHDAVYDPRSSTNEYDSSELAAGELAAAGVPDALIVETNRLIMLTARHEVAAGDVAGAALIDADLAVLGADPLTYQRYVDGVRFEYAFVSDDDWRVGRARVLESLLALPRIFHTESMAGSELVARSNLNGELSALTSRG